MNFYIFSGGKCKQDESENEWTNESKNDADGRPRLPAVANRRLLGTFHSFHSFFFSTEDVAAGLFYGLVAHLGGRSASCAPCRSIPPCPWRRSAVCSSTPAFLGPKCLFRTFFIYLFFSKMKQLCSTFKTEQHREATRTFFDKEHHWTCFDTYQ